MLQCTGPDKRRVEFFRQLGAAYDFMATFYMLPVEKQQELLQIVNKFKAEVLRKENQ